MVQKSTARHRMSKLFPACEGVFWGTVSRLIICKEVTNDLLKFLKELGVWR